MKRKNQKKDRLGTCAQDVREKKKNERGGCYKINLTMWGKEKNWMTFKIGEL